MTFANAIRFWNPSMCQVRNTLEGMIFSVVTLGSLLTSTNVSKQHQCRSTEVYDVTTQKAKLFSHHCENLNSKMFVPLQDSCQKLQKEEEADKVYSVLDLFKSPHLRNTTLLLIVIWYVSSQAQLQSTFLLPHTFILV